MDIPSSKKPQKLGCNSFFWNWWIFQGIYSSSHRDIISKNGDLTKKYGWSNLVSDPESNINGVCLFFAEH